jgi:hypothetical protein
MQEIVAKDPHKNKDEECPSAGTKEPIVKAQDRSQP